jgi:hypothetical protein
MDENILERNKSEKCNKRSALVVKTGHIQFRIQLKAPPQLQNPKQTHVMWWETHIQARFKCEIR